LNQVFGILNEPVKTTLVTFLSGSASAIMIFAVLPMVNVIGKTEEISLYDPLTLLGCFTAGLVSISASC